MIRLKKVVEYKTHHMNICYQDVMCVSSFKQCFGEQDHWNSKVKVWKKQTALVINNFDGLKISFVN